MKPDSILTGFPLDTRLYLGQSRSGPWGQIGTSILAASPSNDNEISVTFPSQSYRYFRVDFRDSPGCDFAIFRTFTLLAYREVDRLESIDTRITQLETVEIDPALEAHVNAVDARVKDNSGAIAILQASPSSNSSHVTTNIALYFDPSIAASYIGGTTLFDLSGNGRDCTLEGGATVIDGVIVLNGDPQYISTTYMPNLDNFLEYTFELWFHDNSPGIIANGDTVLISNYGATSGEVASIKLDMNNNGMVRQWERNSQNQLYSGIGPSIVTGEWVHIVMSGTATDLILYVNGVQVLSGNRPGGVVTSSHPLVIGGGTLGRYQTCKLGPVRIYYDFGAHERRSHAELQCQKPRLPRIGDLWELGHHQSRTTRGECRSTRDRRGKPTNGD